MAKNSAKLSVNSLNNDNSNPTNDHSNAPSEKIASSNEQSPRSAGKKFPDFDQEKVFGSTQEEGQCLSSSSKRTAKQLSKGSISQTDAESSASAKKSTCRPSLAAKLTQLKALKTKKTLRVNRPEVVKASAQQTLFGVDDQVNQLKTYINNRDR